jgi:uncharacterized membrane protein
MFGVFFSVAQRAPRVAAEVAASGDAQVAAVLRTEAARLARIQADAETAERLRQYRQEQHNRHRVSAVYARVGSFVRLGGLFFVLFFVVVFLFVCLFVFCLFGGWVLCFCFVFVTYGMFWMRRCFFVLFFSANFFSKLISFRLFRLH